MEAGHKIETIEKFLEALNRELISLLKADLSYVHFIIMAQSIEVLGGLLDNKPQKSPDQTFKRFSQAVCYLFGGRYRVLNSNRFLYNQMRNQLVHTLMPGNKLLLVRRSTKELKHLDLHEGRLVLAAEDFVEDIQKASERLLDLLRDGKVKPKNIAFGHEE